MKKFILLMALLLAPGIGAANANAAAVAKSPFVKFTKQRRLKVPVIIHYEEFVKAAMAYAMTEDDVRGLFAMLEIPIRGEGDGRYMSGADLLRGCGADCNLQDGMGYLLRDFLYSADLDR